MRRLLLLGLLAVAVPMPAPGARAQELPTPTYTIETRYHDGTQCSITRSTKVPAGVPVPVDAGGTPAPDLVVLLAAVPPPIGNGVATLEITRIDPLPVRLAAVISVGGIKFGYDACDSGAPQTFRATAAAGPNDTTLNVETAGATGRLTFVGAYQGRDVRATTTPVPTAATIAVTKTAAGATAVLTTDVPTRFDIDYTDPSGIVADVTIDRFPGTATIEASPTRLHYRGPEVDTVTVDLQRGAEHFQLTAHGLPTDLRVEKTGPTHVAVRSGRIEDLDIRYTNGATGPLPNIGNDDGLAVRKEADRVNARLRLRGLTSADVDWADPVTVDLRHDARRFVVAGYLDGLTINASASDLPAIANVRFSPTGRSVTYTGSAILTELSATIQRPWPLFGRVTKAALLVRGLPTNVTLTLGAQGSSMTIDANGQTVGLVEALFTSGPDERLDPSKDGVLLRDLPDRYVVFARVTNLRRFSYGESRTLTGRFQIPFMGWISTFDNVKTANLQTNGGRPFHVNVLRSAPAEPDGSEFIDVTMQALPASTDITAVRKSYLFESSGIETTGASTITYRASATTPSLNVSTDAGGRHSLNIGLAPIPAAVDLCTDPTGNGCAPELSPANKGTTKLVASDRTRLTVIDCEQPGCANTFSTVDMSIRKFVIGVGEIDSGFRMWLDTDGHGLTGRVRNVKDNTTEYDFIFPDVSTDLWAQDRNVSVTCGLFSCGGSGTGAIHCPAATEFKINTHHWRWGIQNFAEEICGW